MGVDHRYGLPVIQDLPQPFFLPHLEFARMFTRYRNVFNKVMLGGSEHPEQRPRVFWNEVEKRNDPRLSGHRITSSSDWKDLCIPISQIGVPRTIDSQLEPQTVDSQSNPVQSNL